MHTIQFFFLACHVWGSVLNRIEHSFRTEKNRIKSVKTKSVAFDGQQWIFLRGAWSLNNTILNNKYTTGPSYLAVSEKNRCNDADYFYYCGMRRMKSASLLSADTLSRPTALLVLLMQRDLSPAVLKHIKFHHIVFVVLFLQTFDSITMHFPFPLRNNYYPTVWLNLHLYNSNISSSSV